MTTIDPANRYEELLERLLDKGYDDVAGRVLSTISTGIASGVLSVRLRQLDAEAARLVAAGERFAVDNPVLRALIADYRDELNRYARRIDRASGALVEQGASAAADFTRRTALEGVAFSLRPVWNVPDPEAIAAAVDFTTSEAWEAALAAYGDDAAQIARAVAIRGIIAGRNPVAIARELRQHINTIPRYRANEMMRTLQMMSYREAAAEHQRANADILSHQIRIAALDVRTCLCCIGLHGTRLAVGERVDDHNAGRCTAIAVVRGHERDIQTGEQWFASLSEADQREIAGHANYEAMRAGRVGLNDFVQPYSDPIYGSMVRQASLVSILGDEAKAYYG
jgi:hypothetical protein